MNESNNISGYLPNRSHLSDEESSYGYAFGMIWNVFSQVPQQLCELGRRIQAFVYRYCFGIQLTKKREVSLHGVDFRSGGDAVKRRKSVIDLYLAVLGYGNSHKQDCRAAISDSDSRLECCSVKGKKERRVFEGGNLANIEDDPLRGTKSVEPDIFDFEAENGNIFVQVDLGEVEQATLDHISKEIIPAKALIEKEIVYAEMERAHFLDLLEMFEGEVVALNNHIAIFVNFPVGEKLLQTVKDQLERRRGELEREFCKMIRRQYAPNKDILQNGHCLFLSIEDQIGNSEKLGPVHYRELAVEYMCAHRDLFVDGVEDSLKAKEAIRKIDRYQIKQGGIAAWQGKLQKKMDREPEQFDLYCDCLKHTDLWGGLNEIRALSGCLQVPILVFTQQDKYSWRYDSGIGLEQFKDKEPILLLYNGKNHYQNLKLKHAKHS